MGRVLEPEEARNTGCTCYAYDDELLCFSKGVVGALTDSQELDLCKFKYTRYPSESQETQAKKFKEWGEIADVCFEKGVDTWGCVEKEARKRH